MVVPLENGVEAPEILSSILGKDHVVGGLCAIVSMIDGPGRILHPGIDPVIRFGELDNHKSPRINRLQEAFSRAKGLTVEVPDDIQRALWQKFVFISAWSSVGSVTRAPIGIIRNTPESRSLLKAVLEEVVAVGRAAGVALPADIVDSTIAFYDSVDPTSTASMQRDVQAGKPSELESQTGAIVRLGSEHGVETPAAQFVYGALLPGEKIARGEGYAVGAVIAPSWPAY